MGGASLGIVDCRRNLGAANREERLACGGSARGHVPRRLRNGRSVGFFRPGLGTDARPNAREVGRR